MTTLQAEIYDAFISAGSEEPKARAAAQSVAEVINGIAVEFPKPGEMVTKTDLKAEIAVVEAKITALDERMDKKLAELEARLVHRLWMQSLTTIGIILTALGIAVAFLSTSTT